MAKEIENEDGNFTSVTQASKVLGSIEVLKRINIYKSNQVIIQELTQMMVKVYAKVSVPNKSSPFKGIGATADECLKKLASLQ